MSKYRRLRDRLVEDPFHRDDIFLVPPAVSDSELMLAHTSDYVTRVTVGKLNEAEQKRIGFPWSERMIERSRRSSGATLEAARTALEEGIAVNLAGGTHHAMRDAGEGFCVFNDAAVAIRVLQMAGRIQRAVVIDCDVHQGNGTAHIFQDDASVFTFSIHGEKNFPLRKIPSSLDIDVPDGTSDGVYLELLRGGLEQALRAGPYDLAIYLAGADPFERDRLGRLKISKQGLAQRDELVLSILRGQEIPVAIAMAGGYAESIDDIVDIHAMTIRIAKQAF